MGPRPERAERARSFHDDWAERAAPRRVSAATSRPITTAAKMIHNHGEVSVSSGDSAASSSPAESGVVSSDSVPSGVVSSGVVTSGSVASGVRFLRRGHFGLGHVRRGDIGQGDVGNGDIGEADVRQTAVGRRYRIACAEECQERRQTDQSSKRTLGSRVQHPGDPISSMSVVQQGSGYGRPRCLGIAPGVW